MYGYSAAEVIGKSIDILTPSDRHDEIPKILEKIRQGVRLNILRPSGAAKMDNASRCR